MSYAKVIEIPKSEITMASEQFYNMDYDQLHALRMHLYIHGHMKNVVCGDVFHFQSLGNSCNEGKLIYDGFKLDYLADSFDDTLYVPRNYVINDFPHVGYFSEAIIYNNIIWLESSTNKLKLLKKFGNHIFKYKTHDGYLIYTSMVDFEDIYLNHDVIPCNFCDVLDCETHYDLIGNLQIDLITDEKVMRDIKYELDEQSQIIIANFTIDHEQMKWKPYIHDKMCIICNQ